MSSDSLLLLLSWLRELSLPLLRLQQLLSWQFQLVRVTSHLCVVFPEAGTNVKAGRGTARLI